MLISSSCFVLGSEHRIVVRAARTNIFEGMFRSGDVDIDELLVLGALINFLESAAPL